VIPLVLNLVVYYILATIFSGTIATEFKGRVATISFVTIIVTSVVSHLLAGWFGILAGLLLGATASYLGLTLWLGTTQRQAVKITSAYAIYLVASSFLISYLLTA
jgi:hypothetical protein